MVSAIEDVLNLMMGVHGRVEGELLSQSTGSSLWGARK